MTLSCSSRLAATRFLGFFFFFFREKKLPLSLILSLLVARIARYRETISAIPPYCALWVFGVSTWPTGCDTPPLFCAFPPWRACEGEVRYPPPQKGYLSDTCAIPYENKANGCDTPLCDTISERVLRDMGGYLALGR